MSSLKGKDNPGYRHGYATRGKRPAIYIYFMNMKARCHIKTHRDYPRYGAVGVTVCDRWRFGEDNRTGFECFIEDMGYRPSKAHSIDRIDGTKGYSPDNCRWATATEQANNRRNNRHVTIRNETKTLAEWSRISGIGPKTIRYRLESGVDPEEAVFSPVDRSRKLKPKE